MYCGIVILQGRSNRYDQYDMSLTTFLLAKSRSHYTNDYPFCIPRQPNSFHFPQCEFGCPLSTCSGAAKGRLGRDQALPNACCALPSRSQKDRDTLIEQSSNLLKQSVGQLCPVNLLSLAMPLTKYLFQTSFEKLRWLYYNEEDAAYCFYCIKGFQQNKLATWNFEYGKHLHITRVQNWKEAITRFPKARYAVNNNMSVVHIYIYY